jgi:Cu+-exporting ATPase
MTELVVGGMTCGAWAARIERRLNRLDGVTATVDYATGRAYLSSLGGPGFMLLARAWGADGSVPGRGWLPGAGGGRCIA